MGTFDFDRQGYGNNTDWKNNESYTSEGTMIHTYLEARRLGSTRFVVNVFGSSPMPQNIANIGAELSVVFVPGVDKVVR